MGYFVGFIVAALALTAFILARDAMHKARMIEQDVGRLAAQLKAATGVLERLRAEFVVLRGAEGTLGVGEALPSRAEDADAAASAPSPRPIAAATSGTLPASIIATPASEAAKIELTAAEATTAESTAHDAPTTVPATPSPARQQPSIARTSLEERLGARLTVWLGAIAIALAGALLVKYSFDQGWVGPGVRVTLGALMGVTALGIGEWLRTRAAAISAGLSAAGIAILYASVLAAGELYHFVPPLAAFAFMALVTATAVVLSLRQGPIIAAVGLIGGFATPLLIETGDASAVRLFPYLLLVEMGLLVVSDRRGWWGIGFSALGASLAWVLLWLGTEASSSDGAVLLGFLILSGAAFLIARARTEKSAMQAPVWLAWAAAAGVLIVSGAVLSAGGLSDARLGTRRVDRRRHSGRGQTEPGMGADAVAFGRPGSGSAPGLARTVFHGIFRLAVSRSQRDRCAASRCRRSYPVIDHDRAGSVVCHRRLRRSLGFAPSLDVGCPLRRVGGRVLLGRLRPAGI